MPEPAGPTEVAAPAPGSPPVAAAGDPVLSGGTYEIIRQRLRTEGDGLRERMARLDARRREVFGSVEFKLLQSDRVTTAHNCIPQDMVQLGPGRFLFGFNVRFGLKKEIELGDVFGVYEREEGGFRERGLEPIEDRRFVTDFKRLYNVYEKTTFAKFSLMGGDLFMVFHIGTGSNDLAVFKWTFDGGRPVYVDGRAEAEYRRLGFPSPHPFAWRTPARDAFRYGAHPHVSIEDRVFVECIGGDLTIKVEDNTEHGGGIYTEPVDDRNQKVDDAEIAYAILDHLVLLKIRPYKEPAARYFIYNAKQESVVRVDSIGSSCALLPEDHGLIFPDGYYLSTGELKRFDAREEDLVLERVVHSPNGEDVLHVFFGRQTGTYALLPYRLIPQKVEERITCHGLSLFPDGHLLLFRGDGEPQKHHTIQLRQTPFYQAGHEPEGDRTAFLYQVGNKEVVRCLAEANELLTLILRESPYAELYTDLVSRSAAMADAYPWLASPDGFGLRETLQQIRETADKAVEEFDKVRRLQREAARRLEETERRCREQSDAVRRSGLRSLDEFVGHLTALRGSRGELIALREVRYIDTARVAQLESEVTAQAAELSGACVRFLLEPAALDSHRKRAEEFFEGAARTATVAEARTLETAIAESASGLELLIEIVNGLRIDDATQATRIIDGITAIYSRLNQARAALRNRIQSLSAEEGAARFAAQTRLLEQSAASYLDLCTTPAKCEEYLNRISVQIEEMEGTFAGFDEYVAELADKRTALYEAFEQRKVALVEQRSKQANALFTAAGRILKVIGNRLAGFRAAEEIHAHMASDLMVAKVRDLAAQLLALGDSVKADDLTGRLKSVAQDAVRQLRDRQELLEEGASVIRLGRHRFHVNTQPLELTLVQRDGAQHIHLTGTRYFEEVTDPALLATREVWEQEVVSEDPTVYRAEYLAWKLLRAAENDGEAALASLAALEGEALLARVREFMAGRYDEGYTKGIHDADAARIFAALRERHLALQLARFEPAVRACATVFWWRFCPADLRELWSARLRGFAERNRLFPGDARQPDYIAGLRDRIAEFADRTALFPADLAPAAGEYLFLERIGDESVVVSQEADQLLQELRRHLTAQGAEAAFAQARAAVASDPVAEFQLVRDWVRGFLLEKPGSARFADEIAALLFSGEELRVRVVRVESSATIEGLQGSHPRIRDGRCAFDYLEFCARLDRFEREVEPRYREYTRAKQALLERERAVLRLGDFTPRVLGSFVRNQLIDRVYLPLVGDNLAKQLGAAGDAKRTDLMGLLLLISPPGYGKTTLVEYIASRLGLVFVKINGPALGHEVNSLDPEDAPNAAAREEIERLNLAFEMGDNVMVCLDDIQHCSPEFLQKFISLCDGQRKIEGVWRGRPRTHDLRGRKVAVVMAGNPYTESGQKFKIPDMLANRADTYNLGDIIGGNAEWFKASYIENAATSNPALAPLAARGHADLRQFLQMAETGTQEIEALEGQYAPAEIEEVLSVLRKLLAIREVVLKVNLEYIHSASQAEEFRTEPPFRLQGSYRNMNRLAEKVVPVMNDDEVRALLRDHYRGESQTLATGAEANLLKFLELVGELGPAEAARWEEIKKTFRRNQLTRGGDGSDSMGRVIGQLAAFHAGLESIQTTLAEQLGKPSAPVQIDAGPLGVGLEALRATIAEQLGRQAAPSDAPPAAAAALERGLATLRDELSRAIQSVHSGAVSENVRSVRHELEMIHGTLATLRDVATRQRDYLRGVEQMLVNRAKDGTVEISLTQEMLQNEQAFLEAFHRAIASPAAAPAPESQTP